MKVQQVRSDHISYHIHQLTSSEESAEPAGRMTTKGWSCFASARVIANLHAWSKSAIFVSHFISAICLGKKIQILLNVQSVNIDYCALHCTALSSGSLEQPGFHTECKLALKTFWDISQLYLPKLMSKTYPAPLPTNMHSQSIQRSGQQMAWRIVKSVWL